MTQLSLCAIARNEENALPRCLASVKDVVDEMIVLDTGSTDRTVAIAEEWGAKVYHMKWCDDFAVARNEALKYVCGEWVLVLDADEVLVPEIVPQLKQLMADPKNLVINLMRQEVGASQSPYSLVSRLFRRHNLIEFTRPYHALIDDSVIEILKQESDWNIVTLNPVAILHYGYQAEAINSLDKYTRARLMMEKFIETHPDDPYVCSKLGALYIQIGQIKQGIKFLKQGLKSNQAEAPVLYELYYSLGNAYFKQGNFEKAQAQYQKAITQNILPKLKIGGYINLAGLLQNLGKLAAAKQLYEAVLKLDPNLAIAYYNLGMTLKSLKQYPEAIKAYQQAIKLEPNNADAYQNLGVVYYQAGYMKESLETFQKAIDLHQAKNPNAATKLRQGLKGIGINLENK
ncbi:glycosyl transferase family 2 [Stanieria sp. NIES-3757]|nr:glycosyl transferase family 2 [Stanieria sp. NIES-3757]